MTRETKIGLLVGLAFIIVVGILLSDHMTSSIEPASAPLAVAGNNLRTGLGQPTSEDDATSNAPLAADTAKVTPVQPVPTQEELAPRPVPVAPVAPLAPAEPPVTVDPPVTLMGENPAPKKSPHIPVTLAKAAHESGEELVDATGHPEPTADVETPTAINKTATRSYKAQPGDSLSKMASRLMGGNTKTNRDLIVAVNRSLQSDPDKIIVGRTYAIPTSAARAAAAVAAETTPAAAPSSDDTADTGNTAVAAASPQRPTSTPEYLYTVKPGDTLWKIAVNELGDADTIPAIEELNQDVLKGASRIHPKMKLRLPAKPVAEAN